MKLGTIVENGSFKTIILSNDPENGEAVVIDICGAIELLSGQHKLGRVHWVGSWSGPWGQWSAPKDMIDIIRYGRESVTALERIEGILWTYARSSDGALAKTVLRNPEEVTWQTPIPDPPAYLYFHNNSAACLNFQFIDYGRRKVYHPRNRPTTALIGQGETLFADDQGVVKTDMELGFVVGPDARGVSAMEAMDYVFGYTVSCDGGKSYYKDKYGKLKDRIVHRHLNCASFLSKGSDGQGPTGPVIVTADEVGNPHDLMGKIYFNDIVRGRSHTGAYLDSVRDTLAFYARIMTVRAGTIFALGAPAFDGYVTNPACREPGQNTVAVEFERVGKLELSLAYKDEPEAIDLGEKSPYLWRREKLGLGSSDMPNLQPKDVPAVSHHIWALSHNVDDPNKGEYPAPLMYPRTSIVRADEPITLWPECKDIEISVQLAAVIGSKACYGLKKGQVIEHLLGLAFFIGVLDDGVWAYGKADTNRSSPMFGYFQARFGDGFNRLGQVIPLAEIKGDWRKAKMELDIEGIGNACGSVSDYDCGFEGMIEWLSDKITQLPGDIHVLGPSRATLTIPLQANAPKTRKIKASIAGLESIETTIEDKRNVDFPPWRELRVGPKPDYLAGDTSLAVGTSDNRR